VQTHRMNFPLSEADARKLQLGDQVVMDGEIIVTAGLPTHHRLVDCLDGQEPFPFEMRGQSLFHLGSYSRETGTTKGGQDLDIVYINPTTSTRFNPVMPRLIDKLQLHAVGGKGGLDKLSVAAMQKTGCVYLSFLGGGAALHTQAIRQVLQVGWADMLMHYRLVRLRVEGLGPVTVAIDAHGNSIYASAQATAQANRPSISKFLDEQRAHFMNPSSKTNP